MSRQEPVRPEHTYRPTCFCFLLLFWSLCDGEEEEAKEVKKRGGREERLKGGDERMIGKGGEKEGRGE